MSSRIKREPLSFEVARRIKAAVVGREFDEGESLPAEGELAERFGVGRSTVREALRVVQAQGLISEPSTSTNRPTVRSAGVPAVAGEALATALQIGALPLRDLVEVRVGLETAAVRTVTEVPASVDECLARMAAAVEGLDLEEFHRADVDFHVALAGGSSNQAYPVLVGALKEAIAAHLLGALRREPDPRGTMQRLLDEHSRIAAAVRKGHRNRAAGLLRDHLCSFYGAQ